MNSSNCSGLILSRKFGSFSSSRAIASLVRFSASMITPSSTRSPRVTRVCRRIDGADGSDATGAGAPTRMCRKALILLNGILGWFDIEESSRLNVVELETGGLFDLEEHRGGDHIRR